MGKSHRHLPPLTAAELAEIYDQNPTPVVLRLLWEIHRLRSTVSSASQIRQLIGLRVGRANTPAGIWDLFESDLDSEPCLSDPPTARQRGRQYAGESEGRARRRRRNGS